MPTDRANTPAVLTELASQVRHGTLQLLAAADARLLIWSPPGLSNHILWHAGHAAWLQDVLTVQPLTGHIELPAGWAATFGQNSRPETTKTWPERDVVDAQLKRQLARILALMGEKADAIINHPHAVSQAGGWPLLPGMVHGWHDEARHQGEMYLLHKLWRARRI